MNPFETELIKADYLLRELVSQPRIEHNPDHKADVGELVHKVYNANPNNAQANHLKGAWLAAICGMYREAKGYVWKATQLDPNNKEYTHEYMQIIKLLNQPWVPGTGGIAFF
jgi:hypothetical protein